MSTNKARFVEMYNRTKAVADLGDFLDYTAAAKYACADFNTVAGGRYAFGTVTGNGVVVVGKHGWGVIMEHNFFMSDSYSSTRLSYYRHEGVAMDQTFYDLGISEFPMHAIVEMFDHAASGGTVAEQHLVRWLVDVKAGLAAVAQSVVAIPDYEVYNPSAKVVQLEIYPTIRKRVLAASHDVEPGEDYLLDVITVTAEGLTAPVVLTNLLASGWVDAQGYSEAQADVMRKVRSDIIRRCL